MYARMNWNIKRCARCFFLSAQSTMVCVCGLISCSEATLGRKSKGKIHWVCIAFSSFLLGFFTSTLLCVCLLFLSAQRRTLNYLDINIHTRVEKKWKQNKNKNKRMNVWLSRRFAENGPKWDRIIKKTHRNKLNRETMLKKPLLFESSPTNENPFQNQSISTHVLFDLRSRLLLLLRYYINIICWLTNINIVFFSSSFFLYIRLVSFAATFFYEFSLLIISLTLTFNTKKHLGINKMTLTFFAPHPIHSLLSAHLFLVVFWP